MHTLINLIQSRTNLSHQEAWWLLEHISGQTQAIMLLSSSLSKNQIDHLEKILIQISQDKKPLAYILGSVPFLDLNIKVSPPILIPRHETEEWVQHLIKTLSKQQDQITKILDMGTGSGCIALALAKAFPQAHIIGVDINPKALDLAAENAHLNNIKNVEFINSNLFETIQNQQFDLIVSNPPYINQSQAPCLPPEVALWEDQGALFADNEGLAIIVEILRNSDGFLKNNPNLPAQLVIEIGYDQKDTVLRIAQEYGWNAQAQIDSFGQWRTIWAKK